MAVAFYSKRQKNMTSESLDAYQYAYFSNGI